MAQRAVDQLDPELIIGTLGKSLGARQPPDAATDDYDLHPNRRSSAPQT